MGPRYYHTFACELLPFPLVVGESVDKGDIHSPIFSNDYPKILVTVESTEKSSVLIID